MKEFKIIRESSGMTQAQIVSVLGVKQSTVATWENNERAYPRGELLPKLADTLGCTIDALYGRGKEE